MQSEKQAEKVVREIKSGMKIGPNRHWCHIHSGSINKVYIIGKEKDKLFWSEDCAEFQGEMQRFHEERARRRALITWSRTKEAKNDTKPYKSRKRRQALRAIQ